MYVAYSCICNCVSGRGEEGGGGGEEGGGGGEEGGGGGGGGGERVFCVTSKNHLP